MNVRATFARAVHKPWLRDAVLGVRWTLRAPLLTVVNYHRVADPSSTATTDLGVIDATPASFDRQISMLRRNFSIIGLDDLRAWHEGTALPPNPALVTFDDGYRDCYDRVLPILRRHEAKAAFFIPTDYVERRRLFWWDKVAWILKHTREERISLDYPSPVTHYLDLGVEGIIERVLGHVKRTFGMDIDRYVAELAVAARVPWTEERERELADDLLMTWEHVRALRAAGMDIGSHTRTHRPLETLDMEALRDELVGSKADLENVLQEPIDAISYPVGRSVAHNPVLRGELASAGYCLGFTYNTGVQYLVGAVDPLNIHRFAAEVGDEEMTFLLSLIVPPLGRTHADSS